MPKTYDITVPADPDEDDCLTAAAEDFAAGRPALAGYDLSPRWTDENERDTVTLTVPAWAAPVDLSVLEARVTRRGSKSTVPDNAGAVDAALTICGEVIGSVTLLPDPDPRRHGELSTWGSLDNWADDAMSRWIAERVGAGQERTEVIDAIVSAVRSVA